MNPSRVSLGEKSGAAALISWISAFHSGLSLASCSGITMPENRPATDAARARGREFAALPGRGAAHPQRGPGVYPGSEDRRAHARTRQADPGRPFGVGGRGQEKGDLLAAAGAVAGRRSGRASGADYDEAAG